MDAGAEEALISLILMPAHTKEKMANAASMASTNSTKSRCSVSEGIRFGRPLSQTTVFYAVVSFSQGHNVR